MPSAEMDFNSKNLVKDSALLASASLGTEERKPKKENKKKHQKIENGDDEEEMSVKKIKYKKTENGEDEEAEVSVKKKRKRKKNTDEKERNEKVDVVLEIGEEKEEEEGDPKAMRNFRISKSLVEKLKSKGIKALFPIQAMTFDFILDGFDLVARARTGQGKTLAFVLPILESLINGPNKMSRKTGYGRPPTVLVLLPTRELANQVYAEFEFYGAVVGLSACCLYGGSPYHPQEFSLRKGVDIIVGTPGRIKDHLERGTLNLKSLKFRILDESDEMLNMGFVDHVEFILQKVEDSNKVQTLLFSATLPDWVKKLSSRFLKTTKKVADLVGNEKMKASDSVKHLVLPCSHNARSQLIPDIIRCYSGDGRTIIFTETKESASELAGLLPGSRALHGDIVQNQREVILAGFRSGRFLVLVATNVAARGLDINDVQLIIQCEPPRDVEAYIHRSGRTGRAGNTGVAVLLCEPRFQHAIVKIERESGFKFERISAPQPADVAKSAGLQAADSICAISDSVIPVFRLQAEELISNSGLSIVELLAKALAKCAGYTDIKTRSLLSSVENNVTLILKMGKPIYSPSFAYDVLRRFLSDGKVEGVKGLCVTADGTGAVFDVPSVEVESFIEAEGNENDVSIEVLTELPPLQEKDKSRGGRGGSFGGGYRNGFGGRGGSFGRRGSFSSGRGGRGYSFGRGNGRFSNPNSFGRH